MAVDHVCLPQLAKYRKAEWVRALAADEPGPSDHTNPQPSCLFLSSLIAKRDERRRNNVGHVTGQLVGVTLGATNDAGRSKERRNEMNDAHGLLHHLELEVQKPRWKHPRPSPLVLMRPPICQTEDRAVDDRSVETDSGVSPSEPSFRVVRQLMTRVKGLKAPPSEPVAVRNVGKCIRTGEVRDSGVQHRPGFRDSMNLFEGTRDVTDVFEHVVRMDLVEAVRRKRPRHRIQVVHDVGAHVGADVEIHGIGEALLSTSEIQSRRVH